MRDPRRTNAGPWRRGALLFAAAFWLADLALLRSGVPDPLDDSWEYGVAARVLASGHGFRTLVVHPPLWGLRDAHQSVPVLVHGPLLPAVLVPIVGVFGRGALDHVAWLAALFAVLAAASTFALGARLVSAPVGAAAAALLTVSPLAVRAVHHDVALLAGAWLLALALDLLARDRPATASAGVALGLGALVRPEFLWVAPIVLALARERRARFALAFAACIAPWAWHGWTHAGSPWFNLSGYLLVGYQPAWPGISVMRDFALPPAEWPRVLQAQLPHLPRKWLETFPHALKRVLAAPSGATGWLAPLGAVFGLARVRARRLAIVAATLALVPLAIQTLTLYDARYVTPFLPLFALGAALGASELAEWLPPWLRKPRAWMGALALLVLPSAGPALNDGWREARANAARLATERAALARAAAGRPALAWSDTPDFVAWTTGIPTVWVSREQWQRLPVRATAAPPGARQAPARHPADLAWFHDDDGRGPVHPVAVGAAESR